MPPQRIKPCKLGARSLAHTRRPPYLFVTFERERESELCADRHSIFLSPVNGRNSPKRERERVRESTRNLPPSSLSPLGLIAAARILQTTTTDVSELRGYRERPRRPLSAAFFRHAISKREGESVFARNSLRISRARLFRPPKCFDFSPIAPQSR